MTDNKEVITLFVAPRETKTSYFHEISNFPHELQRREIGRKMFSCKLFFAPIASIFGRFLKRTGQFQ